MQGNCGTNVWRVFFIFSTGTKLITQSVPPQFLETNECLFVHRSGLLIVNMWWWTQHTSSCRNIPLFFKPSWHVHNCKSMSHNEPTLSRSVLVRDWRFGWWRHFSTTTRILHFFQFLTFIRAIVIYLNPTGIQNLNKEQVKWILEVVHVVKWQHCSNLLICVKT